MRHYKMVFQTKGPVHVGNGETIGKKDYFRQRDGTIAVLDAPGFVGKLNPDQLNQYCNFLVGTDSRTGLQDFLDHHSDMKRAAASCVRYSTSTKLSKAPRGSYQYHDVHACIKDAYGRPYVPGSSIKGMLRTALLTVIVLKKQGDYQRIFQQETRGGFDKDTVARATRAIERRAFWIDVPSPQDSDKACDIMRFVSVSDSEPLELSSIVFAKKYDKFSKDDDGHHKHDMGKKTDRQGNQLDVYRECIRPGTAIVVNVDIDEHIDRFLPLDLDAKGLASVLMVADKLYQECFLKFFEVPESGESQSGSAASANDGRCRYVGPSGLRCRNRAGDNGYCSLHQEEAKKAALHAATKPVSCYLGGGVGFDEKTVINAVLRKDPDRVSEIAHVLYEQFPSRVDPSLHQGLQRSIQKARFKPETMHAQYRGNRLSKAKDDHRHWQDPQLSVSPHTLKLGIVDGKKYQMGLCELRIEERQ